MSTLTTTHTVDGVEVKRESVEAYEAVAKQAMGAWDDLSAARGLVPERYLADYDEVMSKLFTLRSRISGVATGTRAYRRAGRGHADALKTALEDADRQEGRR